ncbi:sensor histidine kinase (plasmid) [Catenovulum sp. SX2]|uniref:sensor histidine kinase n=1 Tax=Catenovulum sp. SX2 TaxID=3398614 RepID=UPI003F8307D9
MSNQTVEQLEQKVAALERKLAREKQGRAHAENLLEDKARSLYHLNEELSTAYETLKKQEIQVIQQEKLASIGQLSAGVAHEINTPTGYVLSNMDTLTEYTQQLQKCFTELQQIAKEHSQFATSFSNLANKYELDYILEDLPDLMSESRSGLLRIKSIVSDLRAFSHAEQKQPEQVDLLAVIEQTLNLVQNEIKYTAALTVDLKPALPVLGFAGKLSQVFLNLLVNASQALKGKGDIKVSLTNDGNQNIVKVADSGCGIAPEIIAKIFDPFFSTKDVGKGTGLGLAISKEIINQHNGHIWVESIQGQGTTFTITLPGSTKV